jgi:hypothetical protein
VLLDAVVIAPTVRPAFVKSVVAAAWVTPTTEGTVTGGPEEMTTAMALSDATCIPLAGFWLMTNPAATVVLDAIVTVPSVRPTFIKFVIAEACVSPTTEGTMTCTGPVETTRLTALPGATCVPPTGFWLMTDPAGTVELAAVETLPTVSPMFVNVVVAAACVAPTTEGTVTIRGPEETTRLTALPAATGVPLVGFWLMTSPAATVVLDAVVTVPTVRPAFVKVVVAAACVAPTTEGTVTVNGAARISTMLRLYRSVVGAVSLIVTDVALRGVALFCRWTQ